MNHHPAAALARIERLRKLQADAARTALAGAAQDEQRARAAHAHAVGKRDAALASWHAQLGGSGFSPELSNALAAAFGACDTHAGLAGAEVERATDARRACADRWHASEARCRQTGALLDESRRREARAREEKALLAVGDRVTFTWRRR